MENFTDFWCFVETTQHIRIHNIHKKYTPCNKVGTQNVFKRSSTNLTAKGGQNELYS